MAARLKEILFFKWLFPFIIKENLLQGDPIICLTFCWPKPSYVSTPSYKGDCLGELSASIVGNKKGEKG